MYKWRSEDSMQDGLQSFHYADPRNWSHSFSQPTWLLSPQDLPVSASSFPVLRYRCMPPGWSLCRCWDQNSGPPAFAVLWARFRIALSPWWWDVDSFSPHLDTGTPGKEGSYGFVTGPRGCCTQGTGTWHFPYLYVVRYFRYWDVRYFVYYPRMYQLEMNMRYSELPIILCLMFFTDVILAPYLRDGKGSVTLMNLLALVISPCTPPVPGIWCLSLSNPHHTPGPLTSYLQGPVRNPDTAGQGQMAQE